MLYRDGTGLVVTDLRIHILYDITVDFICHSVFFIEPLYGLLLHPHQRAFRLAQGVIVLCRRLPYFLLFGVIKSHIPFPGQQIHGFDLGDFGQHCLLYIFLQSDPLHGNVPHLRTVYVLILILGIDQIHHHLRQCTDRISDAEHLILVQACGEYHLCTVFIPAGCKPCKCKKDTAKECRPSPWISLCALSLSVIFVQQFQQNISLP